MSFNITLLIISFSLLSSLTFGVFFASSEKFAFPNLLTILLFYSFFLVVLLISFFGNDFVTLASCLYYFNQYFQSFFLIIVSLIILVSRDFVNNQKITRFEYDTLLLFVFLSALCLCFADDFLLFYLAIELQSLCFYVFATFARTSEYSTESGLKYFVFGAIISCVLLLGFSFIYITFGTVSFEFLSCLSLTSAGILFLGILFVLIALLFKIGAAPFHL